MVLDDLSHTVSNVESGLDGARDRPHDERSDQTKDDDKASDDEKDFHEWSLPPLLVVCNVVGMIFSSAGIAQTLVRTLEDLNDLVVAVRTGLSQGLRP